MTPIFLLKKPFLLQKKKERFAKKQASISQEYQPSGKGGTRSPPATPHRLQNPRWPPGGPKMADGVRKGVDLYISVHSFNFHSIFFSFMRKVESWREKNVRNNSHWRCCQLTNWKADCLCQKSSNPTHSSITLCTTLVYDTDIWSLTLKPKCCRPFFHKRYCFDQNFLTDANFSNTLLQVIYILRVVTTPNSTTTELNLT